jgi:hypothetical protein
LRDKSFNRRTGPTIRRLSPRRRVTPSAFENLFEILEAERLFLINNYLSNVDQILEKIRQEFLKHFIIEMTSWMASEPYGAGQSRIYVSVTLDRMKSLWRVDDFHIQVSSPNVLMFHPEETDAKNEHLFEEGQD